ncbi:MAG: nucleotidyl transferase AbiEii/AbiGii toxin family protein [Actinomycetota bacterium]|nr:nucleotidyl transferase AbiEii/AbiGii toxin family protein [Actinomycetota bacterium]
MKDRQITNLEASIRQRLLNLSRTHGEDFGFVLTRYANERFLYRLYQSEYADRFILKGGMLFLAWTEGLYRPTRDIDFLGFGDNADDSLINTVKDICATPVEQDGLAFNAEDIKVIDIREDEENQGKRITLNANLGAAQIPLQLDIGFGDAVVPEIEIIEYPTMLGSPAPRLRAYPKETVVAEKLEAIVKLGMVNSRMKDFYDIWMMSKMFAFSGHSLQAAIKATFHRRKTPIPNVTPIALTHEFAEERDHKKQWSAFLRRNRLDVGGVEFSQVIDEIYFFLNPIISAIAADRAFSKVWSAGGPWNDT